MASQIKKPNIFDYDNYRHFIRDYYVSSNAQNKKFSHRFFSRLAGFKSSNFIKFVIDGKSNVSPESAERLAKAMKLTKEEAQFFKNLVLFNQAKSSTERHQFAQELISSRAYRKIHPLNEALFNYTSKWYLSPLRGAVGLPGFREDPEWLSRQFSNRVTPGDIKKGLEELLTLGLIKRDESGKLVQSAANVASPDEVTSASVASFHREMMKRASESIDLVPREKRDLSAMTIGVSVETAKKLKERLQSFRREITDLISQGSDQADAIYQLNFHLFPLFEIESEEKP